MNKVTELPKIVSTLDIIHTINEWNQKKNNPEHVDKININIESVQEAINRYKQPKVIT